MNARLSFRPLLRRLLPALVLVVSAGVVHAQPTRGIEDLELLLRSYALDEARVGRLRAELDKPLPAPEAGAAALARAWHERAIVAEELGEVEASLDALERGIAAARELSAGGGSEVGSLLRMRLDRALALRGVRGLVPSLEAYEALLEEHRGNPAGWMIAASFHVASSHITLGDLAAARRAIERAERIAERLGERPRLALFRTNWAQFIERAKGLLARREGRLDEEERAVAASLRMVELDIENNEKRRAAGLYALPRERAETLLDQARVVLAGTYMAQQRLDEADLLLREVLKRTLQRNGRNSRIAGNVLKSLGLVQSHRGRSAAAVALAGWGDRALAEAGLSPLSPERLNARVTLANLLAADGRHGEAAVLFDELRRNIADDSRLEEGFSPATLNSIRAYLRVGRLEDALRDADAVLADHRRHYGEDHYATAEARGYRAEALRQAGRVGEARQEFARAIAVLIDASRSAGRQLTSQVRVARLRLILNDYLSLLAGARGAGAGADSADVAEAFRIADVARWQSVQKAVAGSAARAAAGSPELAALIKKVQDADDELQAVYKNLIAQRSAPPDRQLPQVIAAMEARIAVLRRDQAADLAAIRRQFPQYDELVNPRPADLERARSALRPGEVLLSIYVTPQGSYVWALGREGAPRFHFSSRATDWIAARVKRLRAGVDLAEADTAERLGFDLDAAAELYRELLAPVADAWREGAADTLLVVANEALGQIPFSLLPTTEGAAPVVPAGREALPLARYRAVPWLARQVAVAYLPSVSALVTLRALPPAGQDRDPFLGFGDPDFGAGADAASGPRRGLRGLRAAHPVRALRGEAGVAVFLSPLPDTRAEIAAIARALRADPARDAHYGAEASVGRVMASELRRRRVLAFATHGLVAGDLPGLDQPALALAPPAGRPVSDGLLRLDHILRLSLDADLVVLSACNTAADDGGGVEAVSGLGRGFFYAGARAILATHWPVETVSARRLMVGLFEGYGADPTLTRAQALRRAMLDLIDRGVAREGPEGRGRPLFSYAHPAFWAPYALYGDPGR